MPLKGHVDHILHLQQQVPAASVATKIVQGASTTTQDDCHCQPAPPSERLAHPGLPQSSSQVSTERLQHAFLNTQLWTERGRREQMKHAVTILRGQSFGVACSSVTVIVGVMLQKVAENHQATHARQLVKAAVMVLSLGDLLHTKQQTWRTVRAFSQSWGRSNHHCPNRQENLRQA